jgi:phosphoribosylformylglycinamidine (FGAM) synthase-like amidotransferase family enzyme
MQHIMDKHGAEFAAKGITEQHIPHLAEKATTTGEIVGTQGSTRTIYKTDHNGQTQHVAVETGNNGFVVGMNPSSEKSVKKAAKAWKAKLAKNAANPPDHHPGPNPGPGPSSGGSGAAGAVATRRRR